MTETTSLRAGGWAGIVHTVLSLAVLPLLMTPPFTPAPVLGAPGEAYVEWYGAHRLGFLLGNYLGIAALIAGFVQIAVLAGRIRAREGATGWLAWFVLSSGAFTYAVFACNLMVFQAVPFLTGPESASAAFGVGTVANVWFALDGLAAISVLVAVAWAAYATQALSRSFASFSIAVALVMLVMSFGGLVTEPAWLAGGGLGTLIGFVVFFVWTLVLAIIFLRQARALGPSSAS